MTRWLEESPRARAADAVEAFRMGSKQSSSSGLELNTRVGKSTKDKGLRVKSEGLHEEFEPDGDDSDAPRPTRT